MAAAGGRGWSVSGLVPGMHVLRHYERAWLRPDVLAGVTVAAYLIPQVMAYAQVARLPAALGLWAVVASLLVYALVGSSPQLSVGPESTTALMTATVLAPLAAAGGPRYAALAAALALVVGVLCVIARLGRLGFLADLLSRPVLVGYMAGVALIMIASQLGKVTGVPVSGTSFIDEVSSFVRGLGQVNLATVLLSAGMLAFLFLASHQYPRAPVPLIAVLLAVAMVAIFSLKEHGVSVVGPIPSAVPAPHLPHVSAADYAALLPGAIGVTVVGYTDNVLTGRAFAARNGYQIDANQELLALGAVNVAAALAPGFPVSSSGSRTAVGNAMGSRTQLHSLVAVVAVLLTMLLFRPVLALFPNAALGAIVIFAATRLIDLRDFRRIARFRFSEIVLAVATTVGVLAAGVLSGVLIAVALSILDLLRRVARPHDGILGYVPGLAGMHDIDDYPTARLVPGLIVYRYDSPLFFANASDFTRRALGSLTAAEGTVEWFVLNTEGIVEIDITGIDALDEVREELTRRGVVFVLARVKQELRDDLAASGFLDRLGDGRTFPTLPTAVEAYLLDYRQRHGQLPKRVPPVQPFPVLPPPEPGTPPVPPTATRPADDPPA